MRALVREAFDRLFSKHDDAVAERFWSPDYIQDSAPIAPGREGLFDLIKSIPPTLKYEPETVVAEGDTAAFGVYAASKATIRSFVRTWTTDLKDRRIRSNVVSPGPINTPLASRQSPDVIARIVSTVPMGRMGEPDEVAKVAMFLASDDSSFVTGIELFVDGGRAQI